MTAKPAQSMAKIPNGSATTVLRPAASKVRSVCADRASVIVVARFKASYWVVVVCESGSVTVVTRLRES